MKVRSFMYYFLIGTPQHLLVSLFGEINIEMVSVFKILKPPMDVELAYCINTMLGAEKTNAIKTLECYYLIFLCWSQ